MAVSRKSANFKWIIDVLVFYIDFFVGGLYFTLNGTTYTSGATVLNTILVGNNNSLKCYVSLDKSISSISFTYKWKKKMWWC